MDAQEPPLSQHDENILSKTQYSKEEPQPFISTPEQKSSQIFNKSFFIVVGACLIIAFGTTAYLLASQNTKKSSEELAIATVATSTPTPTFPPSESLAVSDSTSEWKTYKSLISGYSIKYPKDWVVKNLGQTDPKIIDFIIFNPNDAENNATTISISNTTRTYQEVLALGAQNSESITVASIVGTKKTEKNSAGVVSINVILPIEGNTLIFYSKENYSDVLYQMLSTFKLLNQ